MILPICISLKHTHKSWKNCSPYRQLANSSKVLTPVKSCHDTVTVFVITSEQAAVKSKCYPCVICCQTITCKKIKITSIATNDAFSLAKDR